MSKKLTINDFKHDGTGYKYEIKAGDKVDLYLDFTTSALLRENEGLKAQRNELLVAIKGALQILKQTKDYRTANNIKGGDVFLDAVIEHAEAAIENCK